MIITDIKQIDRIAEETFGNTKGIISVDMKDYAFIKKQPVLVVHPEKPKQKPTHYAKSLA